MTLSRAEIRQIREGLNLTQVQFATLLGVHPLTVSKWEREGGALKPTPHQQALIESFRVASDKQEKIGETVAGLLITAGALVALVALLNVALEDKK